MDTTNTNLTTISQNGHEGTSAEEPRDSMGRTIGKRHKAQPPNPKDGRRTTDPLEIQMVDMVRLGRKVQEGQEQVKADRVAFRELVRQFETFVKTVAGE